MARGWESKSVEEQVEAASIEKSQQHQLKSHEQAEKSRQLEGLLLNRARVVQQLRTAVNERYRTLLNAELKELDARVERLK
jgi:hypothetical protein